MDIDKKRISQIHQRLRERLFDRRNMDIKTITWTNRMRADQNSEEWSKRVGSSTVKRQMQQLKLIRLMAFITV